MLALASLALRSRSDLSGQARMPSLRSAARSARVLARSGWDLVRWAHALDERWHLQRQRRSRLALRARPPLMAVWVGIGWTRRPPGWATGRQDDRLGGHRLGKATAWMIDDRRLDARPTTARSQPTPVMAYPDRLHPRVRSRGTGRRPANDRRSERPARPSRPHPSHPHRPSFAPRPRYARRGGRAPVDGRHAPRPEPSPTEAPRGRRPGCGGRHVRHHEGARNTPGPRRPRRRDAHHRHDTHAHPHQSPRGRPRGMPGDTRRSR